MTGLQEQQRAFREDVDCGAVVGRGGGEVAGGDNAEVLVGFVVLAFCNSA